MYASSQYINIIGVSQKLMGPSKLHSEKAWKALHFVMRVLKKGNRNTKSLVHTSLVRPILEYGVACWDPCREGQINALDLVQRKLLNLLIIRRNLTGKPSLSVGRCHANVHFSKRTLWNGFGKLQVTISEALLFE